MCKIRVEYLRMRIQKKKNVFYLWLRSDSAAHSKDHVDIDFGIDENTESANALIAVVDQQESCVKKEQPKKRGRPRKGDSVVRQEHNMLVEWVYFEIGSRFP